MVLVRANERHWEMRQEMGSKIACRGRIGAAAVRRNSLEKLAGAAAVQRRFEAAWWLPCSGF